MLLKPLVVAGLVSSCLFWTSAAQWLGAVGTLAVHPNHVTLAEIEFNPKTNCFEVALCVAPEDLQEVLAELHKQQTSQSAAGQVAGSSQDVGPQSEPAFKLTDEMVGRYAPKWLAEQFRLRFDGTTETASAKSAMNFENTAGLKKTSSPESDAKNSEQPANAKSETQVKTGQFLPIRWVGCQLEIKKAWLYFEIRAAEPGQKIAVKKFKLDNRLFLKTNQQQVNHVKFKYLRDIKWFSADRRQTLLTFDISEQ